MKKKAMGLLVCVFVLAGLSVLYVMLQNKNNQQKEQVNTEGAPSADRQDVTLIDKEQKEIAAISLTNTNGTLEYVQQVAPAPATSAEATPTPDNGVWQLATDPTVALNQTAVGDMAGAFARLMATKVSDTFENPAEYGLDPQRKVVATATYQDGSKATLYIGKQTPMQDGYYLQMEGDPKLYTLNNTTSNHFFYSIDDVIDKQLPTIDPNAITYVSIVQKDKKPLEAKAQGTEEEQKNDLTQYGALSLSILQPYPGRDLYMSNFQKMVLDGLDTLSLGNLVDLHPEDLSKYGLAEPTLAIQLTDVDGTLDLRIGGEADPIHYYCMAEEKPYVFLMDKANVQSFFDMNMFQFMSPFVALVNIDTVDKIEIQSPTQQDTVILQHVVVPATTADEKDTTEVHATVNGKEVQEKAFKTFYQSLIGIGVDSEIPVMAPKDKADVTIIYTLNNGKPPIVTNYYEYNKDFYGVQVDGGEIQFAVSKQSINQMYTSMADLLAGKLDK